ncbi:beta-galactosidase [Fragilariopsis cylindrus CCMP1102]|uniref:beta-glucosidase n=1 Tax=Fragilariopsis cylindrus CCMP1102 TaxID=635003 RepID=A0A1E7FQE0_9STRA|nr:beta-galactosidase [Fragilariopsis cylindrus CCMP1102]|eukprot:OEU20389.1 beta-galactosidase [Fragilariopsis cylindrus CCMP1102]
MIVNSNSPFVLPSTNNNHGCDNGDDVSSSSSSPATSTANLNNSNHYLNKYSLSKKLSWLSGYDLWNLRSSIPINIDDTTTTTTTETTSRTEPPATSTATAAASSSSSILRMSDGPHGVRKPLTDLSLQQSFPATCFPSACALSNSWNTKLLKDQVGTVLKKECLFYNIQILLSPGINIKRHPYGGRNHEYFSEDPFLTGILSKSLIAGIQDTSVGDNNNNNSSSKKHNNNNKKDKKLVGACLKHFALNNQETYRMIINVICDERTMREIYLSAFEICISSKHPINNNNNNDLTSQHSQQQHEHEPPALIMGAYNKVNGVYCCENSFLLQQILRTEWNFQGVVVSDWGAIDNRIKSIIAGCDLEMPGNSNIHEGPYDSEVLNAAIIAVAEEESSEENNSDECDDDDDDVADDEENNNSRDTTTSINMEGDIITKAIDECANRVIKLVTDYSTTAGKAKKEAKAAAEAADSMFYKHNQIAREVAQECIVMLQNQDNLLPLSLEKYKNKNKNKNKATTTKTKTNIIAVIGDFGKNSPRIQGMGSAHVTPTKITSIYDSLQSILNIDDNNENEFDIPLFARGYDADADDGNDDNDNEHTNQVIDQTLINEALQLIITNPPDVVIISIGLPDILESEGFDRTTLQLPKQQIDLVNTISRVHKNIVLVLNHGGIIDIPQSWCTIIVDDDGNSNSSGSGSGGFGFGIKTILDGYLLGQAGGQAIVDVIFGIVSPSGKLSETIPIIINDDHQTTTCDGGGGGYSNYEGVSVAGGIPSGQYFPGNKTTVEYREGLDVGYRYYNNRDSTTTTTTTPSMQQPIPVRFPFGHGLTYTNFEYTNLNINIKDDLPDKKRVIVTLDVQNIGRRINGGSDSDSYSGFGTSPSNSNDFTGCVKEVVQLYIRPINSSVHRPYHELKEFTKIEFTGNNNNNKQNSVVSVRFELNTRSFAFYDIGKQDWVVEYGVDKEYEIQIGSSSRDIRLTEVITFNTGDDKPSKLAIESFPPRRKNIVAPVNTTYSNSSSNNFIVDDDIFAKRFIGNSFNNYGNTTTVSASATANTTTTDVPVGGTTPNFVVITRNTLFTDAASVSWIGSILFFISYKIAQKEVPSAAKKDSGDSSSNRKRELRLIRSNLENVPLRGLVLFSQGNFTFQWLDVIILFMNGYYWNAFTTIVSLLLSKKKVKVRKETELN